LQATQRQIARFLASGYAALVGLVALWAWYGGLTLLHSTREHLFPDILLGLISWPASSTLTPLYDHWPALFSTPLVQPAWMTFCGAAQAAVLFFMSGLVPKPHHPDQRS